ncbi:hypothetical protein GCM10010112_85030 [Actinoplanes lobatus]|uniref:Transposase IS200-like domain-containing protein n=1 Tax=Actinoplanes lobatus TaxID=113568 RepID=A0ABQ4AYR7_9ACTN|nr:hypothetical protein GCM10010112_85030 [Actinoplanes lobatus]GIE46119.1 hypothetical protein Alo02nite_90170 [Actinoplanes lobatus]
MVLTTKYRRGALTDPIPTRYEETMRNVCANLGAELREFNGDDDHVHLLVHHHRLSRCRSWATAPTASRHAACDKNTAPIYAATSAAATCGPRPTSPDPAAAHR